MSGVLPWSWELKHVQTHRYQDHENIKFFSRSGTTHSTKHVQTFISCLKLRGSYLRMVWFGSVHHCTIHQISTSALLRCRWETSIRPFAFCMAPMGWTLHLSSSKASGNIGYAWCTPEVNRILALSKWREQSCTECFSALSLLWQELIAILWGWQQWSLGDTSAHPDQCRGRDKSAVSDWQSRAFVTTNVNVLTESWWILNYSAGFCKYIWRGESVSVSCCRECDNLSEYAV